MLKPIRLTKVVYSKGAARYSASDTEMIEFLPAVMEADRNIPKALPVG